MATTTVATIAPVLYWYPGVAGAPQVIFAEGTQVDNSVLQAVQNAAQAQGIGLTVGSTPGTDAWEPNSVLTQSAADARYQQLGTPSSALTQTQADARYIQLGGADHDRGAWAANTSYAVNDVVVAPDGTVQLCVTAHTSGASFTPTDWSQRGVQSGAYVASSQTQSAEVTAVPVFSVQPFTTGNEGFQVGMNSAANSAGGAGTYNHGMWYGWNSGRHSGAPVVAGKPAFIFGIEDNFYDPATSQYTGEFYMEYWSPDGTTVQDFRPFYASIRGTNANAAVNAAVLIAIGTSNTLGEFAVQSQQGGTNYFTVAPNGATFNVPLSLTAAPLTIEPTSGQANLTLNSPSISPVVAFQIASSTVGYLAGVSDGLELWDSAAANKLHVNTTGFGFFGATPVAKPTITGSKGANAALTSLLTALASYGLVTDSTT